jgi:histidine triad (HIT) family protein
MTMSDCVFCRIAAGEIPAARVWEDDEVVAFNDINPSAPVHVLVIPRRHVATLDDAARSDTALMGRMLLAASAVAKQLGVTSGYRVVMNVNAGAGQAVFHVHLHVLGGRGFGWPPG